MRTLSRNDPPMAALIRRAGPYALPPEWIPHDTFSALLRAIVYQQLSTKAAATILSRVLALMDGGHPTPGEVLALGEEALRGAGMSKAKVRYVRDLAQKTVDGVVPPLARLREMEDEQIAERLTSVKGIGRWTVEMMLIRLGRPDVFPVHDLGIRRGYMITYDLPALPLPAELEQLGERWRPYRTVASWYLWRAVHISRGEA